MRSRLTRALGVAASCSLPIVLGTCTEGGTGPGRHRAALAVTTTLPSAAELASFELVIDNVRLIVVRPPSDTLFDQVIPFPANQSTLPLQANVELESDQETLDVTIQLLAGTQVLFSGTSSVPVTSSPTPALVQVPLSYAGPGQSITTLTLTPLDSALSFGGAMTFRPTARDAQNNLVPNFYVSWATSDTTVANIDATGHLTAPPIRASLTVTARTPSTATAPNGVAASTSIAFVPFATQIIALSGCDQTGPPGAPLAQPVVVKVIAGDGLGVQGVTVQFTNPPGGSVVPAQAVTDGLGLVQAVVTLGPTAGPTSFSISAAGLTTVACNQTVLGADHLVFSAQPSSILAGGAFSVVVTAADAQGATVTSFNGLVSLTLGANPGGISFGTSNVTAVSGVATFAGLSIMKAASGYTLVASASGLTSATSALFDVIAGAPSQLAFTEQPATTPAALPITPPVQVVIQDAFGNLVPTATNTVDIALGSNPTNAILSGARSQGAIAGVTAFADLTVDKVGSGYTLVASSSGLTGATSAAFSVTTIGVTTLVFTVQPSNTIAGSVIAPAIVVTAKDGLGNTVTSFTGDVTLDFGSHPPGATLSGNPTVAVVAGLATFTDLSTDSAGGYTLVASSTGLQSVVSASFTIGAGAAAQLVFTTQPVAVGVGSVMTLLRVAIQDALGNTVLTATDNVTLALDANPSGALLNGILTKAASSGVALFTGLSLDKAGSGYTLLATSGTLPPVTSAGFDVTSGATTQLAVAITPPSVAAGTAATLTVTAKDGTGSTVPGYVGTVHFTSSDPLAILPADYAFVAGDLGTHTFTNAATLRTRGGHTVTATDVGTPSITGSGAVTVLAGSAAALAFTAPPGSITAGENFNPPLVVTAQDAFGNIATSFVGSVSLAIANNPGNGLLLGTATTLAVSGLASFASVSVDKTGAGYTLSASATGLSPATSPSFKVTAGLATKLAFVTQPSTVMQGASIAPPVQVAIQDQFGNTDTTRTDAVTMAINPGSAGLGGPTSQAASGGIATFNDLTVSTPGSGYTLSASAPGLGSVASAPFGVLASAAGVSWNNPLGGNWSLPSNWTPARVPGKADTVFITLPGTYTVTLDVNDTVAFLTLGSASGTQTLAATSRTFGIDTAASILANGVLNLTSTTINGDATLTNGGTIAVTPGPTAINAALTVTGGGSLVLNGNNGFADLTVPTTLSNAGTIQLTGTSWAGRLTVMSGTLTNGPGATLRSMASAGNVVTGTLDNQGAVQMDGPLTLNGVSADHQNAGTITLATANLTITQSGSTPSFTTNGNVVVGAGRTLQVNGGAFNYANSAPGGLAGLGTVNLNTVTLDLTPDFTEDTLSLVLANSTVNGSGALHVASTRTLTLTGTTLNVPLDNAGTVQATFGTNVLNGAVTNLSGALLRLNGNNGFADVSVAAGFTNAGTIQLTGTSWAGRLTVVGTLINGSTGILQSVAGVGNVLTTVLNNQGAVQVNGPLTLNAVSADHLNSGTITLGTGDLTISQSGTTPSFTTTGSVIVGLGRTLQVSGGAFAYANASPGGLAGLGSVSVSGVTFGLTPDFTQDTLSLVLTNSIVNGPGILHVAPLRTLTLTGTTLNVALDNQGAVQATPGTNLLNGTVTNAVGALLRLNGNNGFADVTVASGFTNAGTIELTGTSWSGRLTMAGTLVNGPTGTLLSNVSVGNVLTGQLDNQGSVLVNGPLTLNGASADYVNSGTITLGLGNLTVDQSGVTPSFSTSGDVVVGAGRTWTVNSGAVNHTAGKIEGNGTLAFNGVTLGLGVSLVHDTLQVALNTVTVNGPGSLTVATGAAMTLTNCTINTAFINQGTVQAVPGVNRFNGALTNPAGALLQLNGNNGFADVTVASGFTNGGIIELTGTSWAGRLTVGAPTLATLVNAPGATLRTVGGAGHILTAQLSNQGSVLVNGLLTLNGASADHQNSGTITLGSGDLTISQTGATPTFTTTGSVVVGAGRVLQVDAGGFTYANTIPGGLAGLGTVTFGAATVTLTPNVTQDTLTLVPTGTIINGPGTLTVVVGRTLTLTGSTVNTTLNNFGTVQVMPGTTLLNGPFSNQGGAMLRLNGNNGFADATVANGFTNNGTIELTGTSWAGRLTVGSPSIATLVNSPSATLHTLAGAGNMFTGELNNQGTVLVDGPFTMLGAAAGHVNSGLIKLGSGDMTVTESGFRPGFGNTGTIDVGTKKLTVNGTGAFLNQPGGKLQGSGTFDIATPNISFITNGTTIVGGSPGILNWVGTYTQGPDPSVFQIEFGGSGGAPGTAYDQFRGSDNVTLQSGTLNAAQIAPVSGQTYVVISLPAGKIITGDFQTKIGLAGPKCTTALNAGQNQYLIICP